MQAAWKDDKTVEGTHHSSAAGKPLEETFTFTWTSPKQIDFRFTGASGGQTTVFEGKMTRK
jgi:hypothetical protein